MGIDDRPFGATDRPCNCIPAADDPPVTGVAGARWLKDDDVVFGIGINGEFRAYPRRIMEVREMVNDTLGGRLLGIPYCTLCGSAQAYLTDEVPVGVERPVLRGNFAADLFSNRRVHTPSSLSGLGGRSEGKPLRGRFFDGLRRIALAILSRTIGKPDRRGFLRSRATPSPTGC